MAFKRKTCNFYALYRFTTKRRRLTNKNLKTLPINFVLALPPSQYPIQTSSWDSKDECSAQRKASNSSEDMHT